MIKIKLVELDKHRNEIAFRPYIGAQNMSNEQISKPLIVEINDDHYEFTPLKLSDMVGPVNDYFKMAPVAKLLAQRDAFEPEIFEEMMVTVKAEADKIELGTSAFSNEIGKPKNLFYMFWLSLRKKHPNIKKAEFDEMIQEDLNAASLLLDNIGRIIAISESKPIEEDDKEESTRQVVDGTKKKTVHST